VIKKITRKDYIPKRIIKDGPVFRSLASHKLPSKGQVKNIRNIKNKMRIGKAISIDR